MFAKTQYRRYIIYNNPFSKNTRTMAITITKQGNEVNKKTIDVVCDVCGCEFICDNTDFEGGKIKCPNCFNKIAYQDTVTAQKETEDKSRLEGIKKRLKENVLKELDFDTIHEYMEATNWTWAGTANGVPSIRELKKCVYQLIEESVEHKTTLDTGGFSVRYIELKKDDDGEGSIGVDVKFYISNARADIGKDSLEFKWY